MIVRYVHAILIKSGKYLNVWINDIYPAHWRVRVSFFCPTVRKVRLSEKSQTRWVLLCTCGGFEFSQHCEALYIFEVIKLRAVEEFVSLAALLSVHHHIESLCRKERKKVEISFVLDFDLFGG